MAVTLLATDKAVDLCDECLQGRLDGGLVVGQGRDLSVYAGMVVGQLNDPSPHLKLDFTESDLVLAEDSLVIA